MFTEAELADLEKCINMSWNQATRLFDLAANAKDAKTAKALESAAVYATQVADRAWEAVSREQKHVH